MEPSRVIMTNAESLRKETLEEKKTEGREDTHTREEKKEKHS